MWTSKLERYQACLYKTRTVGEWFLLQRRYDEEWRAHEQILFRCGMEAVRYWFDLPYPLQIDKKLVHQETEWYITCRGHYLRNFDGVNDESSSETLAQLITKEIEKQDKYW